MSYCTRSKHSDNICRGVARILEMGPGGKNEKGARENFGTGSHAH